MNPARAALLLFAALLAAAACRAENVPSTASLFVSVLAGPTQTSDRARLDDDVEGSFLLGYRWTDRFSGELVFSRLETRRHDPLHTPADLDTVRADALWHYFRAGTWHPYAVAGIGQQAVSSARREDRGSFVEGGLGLWRRIAGPLQFRIDTRAAWCPDDDSLRGTVAAGLTLGFGGGYRGAPGQEPGLPR